MKPIIFLLLIISLLGCGQSGKLYLPYCPPTYTTPLHPDNIPVPDLQKQSQQTNDS